MPVPPAYEELVHVPRVAVVLPLELPLPEGFDPARPESWPALPGRLEYVSGRLLYMPPCGGDQQRTAVDVVTELGSWRREHAEFVVGGNEAGMLLGGDVRGAEAAVWRRDAIGASTPGFPRVPPVLAVEVAGKDEPPELLREKARWYLAHGVEVVWILVPATRTAAVVTGAGATEVGPGGRLPGHASLPGLEPELARLFQQVSAG